MITYKLSKSGIIESDTSTVGTEIKSILSSKYWYSSNSSLFSTKSYLEMKIFWQISII